MLFSAKKQSTKIKNILERDDFAIYDPSKIPGYNLMNLYQIENEYFDSFECDDPEGVTFGRIILSRKRTMVKRKREYVNLPILQIKV